LAIREVLRPSLYRAPINLWVEDGVTRAYLSAIWNNADVAFLIGGGNEGVRAIAHDAEKAGFTNVFAFVDRDFRQSNKPGWMNPNKTSRIFIPPVHEIENYLLDARALAAIRLNNLSKTEAEIETMMIAAAGRLRWWAACRDVVAELRERFRHGFVLDPTCPPVDSETEARNHICQSPWFLKLAHETGRTGVGDVHQLLSDAYLAASNALSDGTWKAEFAGKEIIHDVGSRICDRRAIPNYNPSRAEFDEDLAKEVGAWQNSNNAVPSDLTDLLTALHLRIARGAGGP
jgi:hypothetical protein